jgi:hypothetical protein
MECNSGAQHKTRGAWVVSEKACASRADDKGKDQGGHAENDMVGQRPTGPDEPGIKVTHLTYQPFHN